VKRAIQEAGKGGGAAAPTRRAREGAATPDRRARGGAAAPPEEVPPPTPTKVKPPPHEEVKPPRRKVARQPVAAARALIVNVQDASWSVKLLHQDFVNLVKVAVHLGVQPSSHPLQTTVMDYAFKINVLVGELERGVLPPSTTTTMAASTSPAPALTPTPTVGLLRRRLPLLN
jgi:hypothetical protein